MGLDMYLYCNSKKVVNAAWFDDDDDAWHKVYGACAYWRKANWFHHWFVEHVQYGNDDCGTYDVSVDQLQELLETIRTVLASIEMVDGKVENGYSFDDGGQIVHHYYDGKVIKDSTVAEELLPVQEGFFFGGYEYVDYYFDSLTWTEAQLTRILDSVELVKYELWDDYERELWMAKGETDFAVKFQYSSSW